MLKSFILKSRKIYAILGAGIILCLCVLTANISYELGQEQAAGYSEEYLELYGFQVFEHSLGYPDITLDDIFWLAKDKTDNYFLTAEEKQENLQNNINRVMELKAAQEE